jgi:hypothetical protein
LTVREPVFKGHRDNGIGAVLFSSVYTPPMKSAAMISQTKMFPIVFAIWRMPHTVRGRPAGRRGGQAALCGKTPNYQITRRHSDFLSSLLVCSLERAITYL